jgi:serine/threonine-protein kinase
MAITVKRLGPYRLGAKLGQGGMGAVFVGHDEDSGETAAIKVLSPALATEEGFRARFESEIESLKKLRHPNIVRLFGYGEQDEYLYYAMELIEGTSLEEELRYGRRFTWREVTRLSISVCRALKHAHDHGIIHRDIKPANLLLNALGEVKLSDFGIARLFGNSRVTSDGGVLGTAEYMAPEQADGRPVTDRCDQYSLGGVMYALLAGRPPFRANSMLEMLQLQRFAEPAPVRTYAPDTPPELEHIIQQLLSKDPQKRFANTLLLSRALEAMELGLSRSASQDDFTVAGPDAAAVPVGRADPLAATLVPGTIAGDGREHKVAPEVTSGTEATLTVPTQAAANLASAASAEAGSETANSGTLTSRFTKVEPLEEEPASWYQEIWQLLGSPQLLVPLLGLLMLLAAAWYLLRPPSPDALYGKIDRLASTGDVDDLLESEGPIDEFLRRYPDDSRAPEVAGYREQLSLARMERRFDREARRLSKSESLTAVERAYLAAVHLAHSDPQRSLARFRALVDVCETPPEDSETIRRVLELSRRQVARLDDQVRQSAAADRRWAEEEFERAAKLAASDPAAARKIWEAIVELFSDKPSVSDVVEKARGALADRLGGRN